MEPVDFEIDDEIPREIKPYRAKVPHGLEEAYKKELERLTKYLYVPSNSSTASPVVVAKKKTHPFIRLCGNYKRVNKFLRVPKYPIPDVIPELHQLIEYPLYLDCDLTNAYHQMPIAKKVSRLLSIQTPFGQFEPGGGVSCLDGVDGCDEGYFQRLFGLNGSDP
jgi:hypothetical protein